MPVVDHLLNALIKFLQKKQKARKRKKSKKARRPIKRIFRRVLKGKPGKKGIGKVGNNKVSPHRKKHTNSNKKQVKSKRTAKAGSFNAGKVNTKNIKSKKDPSEICIGEITHYFSKIRVVVLRMTHGSLSVGDNIHVKGKQADFGQKVRSLQIESVNVKSARKGQLVGLEIGKKARPGDKVFKRE